MIQLIWGVPVDGFEDTPRGGRGDDVVGDALDLHFGAGEAGEVAGDMKFDAVGHGGISRFDFWKIFDVRQAFEIVVLRPQCCFLGQRCGVDDGVRQR